MPDTTKPDPRIHAYRTDLADERLRDRVRAARYVAGSAGMVALPVCPVATRPDYEAELATEFLFGETLRVFDEDAGWAWVQGDLDGYVGYVPTAALSTEVRAATHRVSALATLVQAAPETRAPVVSDLSLGARVVVTHIDGRYAELDDGGHVPSSHLTPIDAPQPDPAAVAALFLGTPYLWGGRSRIGVDCSGLVQLALQACGIPAPRDSDQQLAALGAVLDLGPDLDGLARGDLVFWKGHVGMMLDATQIIHANAHHMAVVAEPLAAARTRIAAAGSAILAVKRIARA